MRPTTSTGGRCTHRTSGEWTHADITISPWLDEHGQVAGCVGRCSDVAAHAPLQGGHHPVLGRDGPGDQPPGRAAPVALPVAPSLDVAATYLLATDDARAGGDWFDAIVRAGRHGGAGRGRHRGPGRPGLRGDGSAARGPARTAALSDEPISESFRSLDRYARLRPESHAATVCVVVIDPASGAVEYCTAGHPPPLVVESDGSTRFLAPSGAGPLTTESEYPTRRGLIGVDDLVLLYTDGLTERPGCRRRRVRTTSPAPPRGRRSPPRSAESPPSAARRGCASARSRC